MIYKSIAQQAGVGALTMSTRCPSKAGELYSEMSGFTTNSFAAWIHHINLADPVSSAIASNGLPKDTWVEIIHTAFSMDGTATWMYYTPGTAIWMNTGTTKVYNDHSDASRDLLQLPCSDNKEECAKQFEQWYKAAKKLNLDSLQFLKHADMNCGGNTGQANLAIEIVDVKGPGTTTCSGNGGLTRYRAGWDAKASCICDTTQKTINCKGYGINA